MLSASAAASMHDWKINVLLRYVLHMNSIFKPADPLIKSILHRLLVIYTSWWEFPLSLAMLTRNLLVSIFSFEHSPYLKSLCNGID